MTDQKALTQGATAMANPTQNNVVPILAYATSDDQRCVSEIQNGKELVDSNAVDEVYNIQVAQPELPLQQQRPKQQQNVKLSRYTGTRNSDGHGVMGQRRNTGQLSGKKLKNGTAFDPTVKQAAGDEPRMPVSLGSISSQTGHKQQQSTTPTSAQQNQVQNVFQFNLRVNNSNGGGIVLEQQTNEQSSHNPTKPLNANPTTGTSPNRAKRNSRQRPMSSKQPVGVVSPNNPYFIHSRKVSTKKRPQSANRKNLVLANSSMKPMLKVSDSFKSPGGLSLSYKKHAILPNNQLMGSAPTQKHRRLHFAQQQLLDQQAVMASGPEVLSENSSVLGPYNRSMKMSSGFGTTNGQSKTFSTNKNQMYSSPDRSSVNKSGRKVPQMTLQSREDLYEQNVHTKIQINSLKNQNRKINTKLSVLENQLVQKDKLFEDMYRAAFSQGKAISSHHIYSTPAAHQQQQQPQQQIFHPVAQAHKMGMTSFQTNTAPQMGNQQHHQAQQLINSYKRTIREQSRELDKRELEVDQIKRSMKMTQINQVLTENETYRNECIRLRKQLEQALKTQQTNTNIPSSLEITRCQESATETFKRDTQHPLATMSENEKEQINRQCELLKAEKQALQARMVQQEQANATNSSDLEQHRNELLNARQEIYQLNQQVKTAEEQLQHQHQKYHLSLQQEQQQMQQQKLQQQELQSALEQMKQQQQQQEQQQQLVQQNPATASNSASAVFNSETAAQQQITYDQHEAETAKIRSELQAKQTIQLKSTIERVQADCEAKYHTEIEQLKADIRTFHQSAKNTLQPVSVEEVQTAQLNNRTHDDQVDDPYFAEFGNSYEERILAEQVKYAELEREKTKLISQQNMNQEAVQKLETEKQQLLKKVKSQTDTFGAHQKKEESRRQMMDELEVENSDLAKKLEGKEKELAERSKEIEFMTNGLAAQKFEYEEQLSARDKQIEAFKQKITQLEAGAYQSPPLLPTGQQRRSTKITANGSNFGCDSEFDRAPVSEIGEQPAAQNNFEDEDDRSDNEFTSNEGDAELGEVVLNNNGAASAEPRSVQTKICVNDKTILSSDGFPLSPKVLTSDSPHVKEGFLRLRRACQKQFIRHDRIENFMFGDDYQFAGKLSIRRIKESAMENLQMAQVAALDFARFIVEQGGQSIQVDDGTMDSQGFIRVDEEKKTQAFKVVTAMQSSLCDLIYFRPDKEEKMKLIVGERLQNAQVKTMLLQEIKSTRVEELKFEEMEGVLMRAGLMFTNKECVQCCFIFLLKKTTGLMHIKSKDFVDFVHQSGAKAHDFTMTGANFPVETDLGYSSDSDHSIDMQDKLVSSNAAQPPTPINQPDDAKIPNTSTPLRAPILIPESVVQQQQNHDAEEEVSDDDEFGANDSRSEDSGRPAQLPESSDDIPDEIEAQSPRYEIAEPREKYKQPHIIGIEDSLNDRDHESSIAKSTTIVPLPLVLEAQEHQEVATIDEESSIKLSSAKMDQESGRKRYMTEPNPVRPVVGAVHEQAQKSDASGDSTDKGFRSSKGKKRPKLNIVVDKPDKRSRTYSQSQATGSTEKRMDSAKPAQDGSKTFQSQVAKLAQEHDNVSSITVANQDVGNSLRPLKKEAPVPAGITVIRQQHSAFGADSSLDSPDPTRRGASAAKDDSILGNYTPEPADREQNTHTDRNMDQKGSLKYDSLVGGNMESQYQTVPVQPKSDDLEEPQTFMGKDMVTQNSSELKNIPHINREESEKESDESQVLGRSRVVKIGVADVENGDISMISPIPKLGSGMAIQSMPSNSKLVDDSFGQGSYQCSAEKSKVQKLPPLELLMLKIEPPKPNGIGVGELLTDRSHHRESSSMSKPVVGTQQTANVRDFTAADNAAEDSGSDYEEDDVIKTDGGDDYEQSQFKKQKKQEGQQPLLQSAQADKDGQEDEEDYEF